MRELGEEGVDGCWEGRVLAFRTIESGDEAAEAGGDASVSGAGARELIGLRHDLL
jgi:hypothetical protein